MLKFDLSYKKKTFVRWKNRDSFIESVEELNRVKQNKIVLFFLTYNLSDSVLRLLEIFNKDSSRNDFDIIIVDNHSNDEHYQTIKKYIQDNNLVNMVLLRSIRNLGGSGGNALGLEYILSKHYDYCIFTEDDAFPLVPNFVSKMISSIAPKAIVRTYCDDVKGPSYPFHFTLYPVHFLKCIGVTHPGYFMRSDDEEFMFRLYKGLKLYGYHFVYRSLAYTHPTIKKGVGKYRQVYFSIRNSLISKMKGFFGLDYKFYLLDLFRQYQILFLYFRSGFSKLFIEKNYNLIYTVFVAVYDYLFRKLSYDNNTKRMNQFASIKNNDKLGIVYEIYPIGKIDQITKDFYLLDPFLKFQRIHTIKHSNKLSNFFKKGLLLSSFNLPLYPFCFFSKKIFSIEEFMENDRVYTGFLSGHTNLLRKLLVLLSFIFALIIFIPFCIMVTIKIFLFKLIRILGK